MNATKVNEPVRVEIEDWHLIIRQPQSSPPQSVIFMNHGWTGDERSMWIFASHLPKEAFLIAPRAPYPSTSSHYGGYSWVRDRTDGWSNYQDFAPAKEKLSELLVQVANRYKVEISRFSMLGFSQGAAFNYAFALEHPEKINKLAGLAGFVPDGCQEIASFEPLKGMPIFIAHGTKDETVPIERARESVAMMQLAGAEVDYCESDVGHKLGANCFSQLRAYFLRKDRQV